MLAHEGSWCIALGVFFVTQIENTIVKRNQIQPPQKNQRKPRGYQEIMSINFVWYKWHSRMGFTMKLCIKYWAR